MIKSDINLLPKKKKLPVSITVGIPLGVILLLILFAIGIILPRLSLAAKQMELDLLTEQLASYTNTESEYAQKLQLFKDLENSQKNYNDFVNADAQTLNLFTKINSAKPATITIEEYTFNTDTVSISGFATSDIEIARFEVALRKTGLFPEISIGNINGELNKRRFIFSLMNKQVQALSSGEVSK